MRPTLKQYPIPSLTIIISLALTLLTTSLHAQTLQNKAEWNVAGNGPHLIAHYMPWFAVTPENQPSNKIWQHWRWDDPAHRRDPNTKLDNGQRQISSVYYPAIGPYSSYDRSVIRYHIKTAQAIGVKAFVVIWYGPDTPDSDRIIPILLEEAENLDFKIAICYEEKINWAPYRDPKSRSEIVKTATADLDYILTNYGTHPAYLKRNNKPFVMQFNYWGEDDLGPRQILADEWQQIYTSLNNNLYFCRQNLDRPDLHGPLQSAFMWFKPNRDHWDQDFKHFSQTANNLKAQNKLDFFMTVICPGFDTTNVWGWGGGPRVLERNGNDILEYTMSRASEGNPELIQLMTWNDWEEATAIEPSREFGFDYLDAIEKWWSNQTGRPVDLKDNRAPLQEFINNMTPQQKAEFPKAEQSKLLKN
ncbi:Glycosyl hydrolase family 71 [Poriferisphaera corsica]|uniref:Glycosyl hydrolase family 71 n=1 Tax=Poriferisphaera corsica TaxID=2528020 RepID=A0A517YXN3_9BACT|nr:endo-1,3-alpha-glucanase family glycosylhydrolase [Poriferisphaera corsica]QDU34990.1 Glycosyl hydrolase family 71 [Poriferisphaera corsica]